ncbi:MAG: DUF4301 family protein [Bacteroidales bacterium]|jgi:hypothetical protein|nr:DUF4301 family protein [Bacteroidales bacterium]
MKLSDQDIEQIKKKGLNEADIQKQLKKFIQGFPYIWINKAATINNGIIRLSEKDVTKYIQYYNNSDNDIIKFVPASGAASRMFKFLFEYLSNNKITLEIEQFFNNLHDFAFYNDLKTTITANGKDIDNLLKQKQYSEILTFLITPTGLNYANLPKGLLKFHKYENYERTPIDEHLVEGANYAECSYSLSKIHFTISKEHEKLFKNHITEVKNLYEEKFGVKYKIELSYQKESSDIVAVDLTNNLFRNKDNTILFRPGGHGALIENLNGINSDIIFIKNIDNIIPDKYKKALAGVLLVHQNEIFAHIELLLSNNNIDEKNISKIERFIENDLCYMFPPNYYNLNKKDKEKFLLSKLNRPIRVCGMVKNAGEPGGGPFWTNNKDKSVSLQIVEKSQIDTSNTEQTKIINNATHFNPVDLICGVRNYKGEKFNLLDFIDESAGFISNKSKDGNKLKAQELPGLWNGAMSDWNTFFVEVPIISFNPVKTVNDLLRKEHQ